MLRSKVAVFVQSDAKGRTMGCTCNLRGMVAPRKVAVFVQSAAKGRRCGWICDRNRPVGRTFCEVASPAHPGERPPRTKTATFALGTPAWRQGLSAPTSGADCAVTHVGATHGVRHASKVGAFVNSRRLQGGMAAKGGNFCELSHLQGASGKLPPRRLSC